MTKRVFFLLSLPPRYLCKALTNRNIVLHYACQTGNVALAKFLLEEHGSNVNINSLTKDHSLPIHFAVAYGHSDLVRYLLTRPVVVPSSVLDLDTNEEISDMLEGSQSPDLNLYLTLIICF